MIERSGLDDGRVLVTFRVPNHSGATHAVVAGEFNDWSHEATPMTREAGELRATVALRPGRAYRFRYLLDGVRWENDWEADRYEANAFGGSDSVVDLTGWPPGRGA